MCGNVAFLAVLVWFFAAESRSDTFMSKITRDHLDDSFTNGICGPCSKYKATPSKNSSGSCTCSSGSNPCLTLTGQNKPSGSAVYVRWKGKCQSSCELKRECCFKSLVEIIVTKKPNCLEGQEVGERNEFSEFSNWL